MGFKQIIVARKDLNMSPGKLAAQVSHASMAFLTTMIREKAKIVSDVCTGRAWRYEPPIPYGPRKDERENNERIPQIYKRSDLNKWAAETREAGEDIFYYRPVDPDDQCGKLEKCSNVTHREATLRFDNDLWDEWINGSFTKVVLQVRNLGQMMKVIESAKAAGMTEGRDFFIIRDNCRTELNPEETDVNGIGRTITCLGFTPMPAEKIDAITGKLNMYRKENNGCYYR